MRNHLAGAGLALVLAATTAGQAQAPRVAQRPADSAARSATPPVVAVAAPASKCDPVTLRPTGEDFSALALHTMGNKDLGNADDLDVNYKVWLRTTPMRVYLDTHVKISELDADHSAFEQLSTAVLFTEPTDAESCEITGVSVSAQPGYDHHGLVTGLVKGEKKKRRFTTFPSGVDHARAEGILSSVECKADSTDDDDRGRVGCKNAKFREIQILRKPRRAACGAVSVQPRRSLVFPLSHAEGDKEMNNGKHTIHVYGTAGDPLSGIFPTVGGGAVSLEPVLKVLEGNTDPKRSSFEGKVRAEVLQDADLPPQCKASSASLQGYKAVWLTRAQKEDHDWSFLKAPADTPLLGVNCRSDSKGEDDGKLGCWLYWKPVNVQLTKR